MPEYTCDKCQKKFARKSGYNAHLARITPCDAVKQALHKCEGCDKLFTRKSSVKEHISKGRCKGPSISEQRRQNLREEIRHFTEKELEYAITMVFL